MGLPEHGQSQMPAFPHSDTWKKTAATAEELEAFQLWKVQMAEWYAKDSKRHSKKHALSLASRILATVQEETELYFVTYADYRGRIYFRGTVHPQAHDSVKGCLEFAEGKQLGATGLFWLKAHVAACAGFDKADFPLRVQWTEQNWHWIERWIRAPLDSPAPDPDTAFTFLAAAGALSEALAMPDPTRYICHIPVAVDATCSGLQHFSALFRDEVGGRYTNLFDSGGTEKQDIYKAVADKAVTILDTPDSNIQSFWGAQGIDRSMSKRPVMTYVYGSTLQSNMEYIALSLLEAGVQPIKDGDKVLYSLLKLSVPVAKAIRRSVQQTVPKAAEGMNYLQKLARYSSEPLRWITPAGMPVVNWSEGAVVRKVFIRAMGVTCILMRRNNGLYDKAKAAEAISPNFIHSLDSSHLCMVLDQVYYPVLPIHDSFACHPCNVDALQQTLRTAFLELYQDNPLEAIMITHDTSDKTIPKVPSSGTLDIRRVLHSRFMFC
jgi:DNA-directed RNA polymerase